MTTFVGTSNTRQPNTENTDTFATSNGTYDMNTDPNTVNGRTYDMYEMRPPPPMYRRVQHTPPTHNVTHMMTLDRRIPGVNNQLQHQLIPNGCDVTLNRRHYNEQRHAVPRRRNPDELWLV